MIMDWLNPYSLSTFDPIPLKALEGDTVILDEHTRCVFTVKRCALDLYLIKQ